MESRERDDSYCFPSLVLRACSLTGHTRSRVGVFIGDPVKTKYHSELNTYT